jgi:hypothetical protein
MSTQLSVLVDDEGTLMIQPGDGPLDEGKGRS